MATDPVCNMAVAPAKVEYQGVTCCFCSHGCHKVFTVEPEKYAQ
jgi:YHS domain-containing protein